MSRTLANRIELELELKLIWIWIWTVDMHSKSFRTLKIIQIQIYRFLFLSNWLTKHHHGKA